MNRNINEQLSLIRKLIPEEFQFSNPEFEQESRAYLACRFKINSQIVICRKAKITPTKVGQFVTVWKRTLKGPIAPFHIDDNFNLVIILVEKDNEYGQFVFPKSLLVNEGIVSNKLKEGKRGFRVYPPWDKAKNKQAIKSQEWQLKYFLSIKNNTINLDRAKELINQVAN